MKASNMFTVNFMFVFSPLFLFWLSWAVANGFFFPASLNARQAKQGTTLNGLAIEFSIFDISHLIFDLDAYGGWQGLGWHRHSWRAKRAVDTAQFIGIKLLQTGHNALGLDKKSLWWGRLLYWLLAGHIDARLQFATSIIFGHEMMHLQEASAAGAKTLFLYNSYHRREVGFWEAYLYLIVNPGPASIVGAGYPPAEIKGNKYINIGQGVNFSSWLSAERAWELVWRAQNVFGFSGYILNALHTSGYAAADSLISADMDIDTFGKGLSQRSGESIAAPHIFVVSILSPLLSPTLYSYIYGIYRYIKEGETLTNMLGFSHNDFFISWDMPTYLNDDSVSLRPMLYARWGKRLLIGPSLEFGILGKPEFDLLFDLRFAIKKMELSMRSAFSLKELAEGRVGLLFHPSLRYDLSQFFRENSNFKLYLNLGMLFTVGKTLKGERLNPYSKVIYQLGFSVTF